MRGDNASPDRSRVGIYTSFSSSQDDTRSISSPPPTPRKSNRRTHRMPNKKVVLKAQRQPSRRSDTGKADTNAKSKRPCGFAIIDDPTIPSPSKPSQNKRYKEAVIGTYLPGHTTVIDPSMQLRIATEETSLSLDKARTSRTVQAEASDYDTTDFGPPEELLHAITSSMARIVIVADEKKEDASHPANKSFPIDGFQTFNLWTIVDSSAGAVTTNHRCS